MIINLNLKFCSLCLSTRGWLVWGRIWNGAQSNRKRKSLISGWCKLLRKLNKLNIFWKILPMMILTVNSNDLWLKGKLYVCIWESVSFYFNCYTSWEKTVMVSNRLKMVSQSKVQKYSNKNQINSKNSLKCTMQFMK